MRWEPCPRIYDAPGAMIERLQEIHPLEGFKVSGNGTVTLALDGGDEVVTSVTGLTYVSAPHPPWDPGESRVDAEALIGGVVSILQPSIEELRLYFQHLVSWVEDDMEPAAACRQSVRRLIPPAGVLGLHDYALLADGTSPSGRTFQVETGVIGEEDAIPRLARIVSRSDGPPTEALEALFAVQFARVSTFVDTTWVINAAPSLTDVAAWVAEEMGVCAMESAQLAVRIHQVTHNEVREDATT